MTWFKADDRLPDHRKVRQLGPDRLASMGLWLLSGCWSSGALTDGFVPIEVASRFHPDDEEVHRAAAGLVRVGLWHPESIDEEAGNRFHDWSDWQPTRVQVETEREASKERARASRDRARSSPAASQRSSAKPSGARVRARAANSSPNVREGVRERHAEVPDPDPARPGPSRPDVPAGTSGGERAGERGQPVASASGGPPPLPSEIENDEPAAWPVQPCGARHDPDRDCGRCGRARRSGQDQADQATLAEARRRADEAERRRRCDWCSETGWLEHPESGTPVVRCDHETDPRKQLADALDVAS